MSLKFYKIDSDYLCQLSKIDKNIKINHGNNQRPYVGIIVQENSQKYFIPMGSPKPKHKYMKNNLTFFKIQHNNKFLGVLNINNMLPVKKGLYQEIIFDDENEKYRYLLYNQWRIINKYEDKIIHNSHILYRLITTEKEKLQKLCPDFLRLEEFCKGF